MARPVLKGTASLVRFPPEVGAALAAKAEREGRRINAIIAQAVGELVLAREPDGPVDTEQSQQVQVS